MRNDNTNQSLTAIAILLILGFAFWEEFSDIIIKTRYVPMLFWALLVGSLAFKAMFQRDLRLTADSPREAEIEQKMVSISEWLFKNRIKLIFIAVFFGLILGVFVYSLSSR